MSAKIERLHGLDFLRGIAALGVLAYHYLHYGDITNISMFGTYGVYLFFCLSGFSLEWVYGPREMSAESVREFFTARFFRIFPMYAVMVALALMAAPAVNQLITTKALLNLTFLFGVNNPGFWSITAGGWSIGVEWFFYILFPIVWAIRGVKFSAVALIITTIVHLQLSDMAYFSDAMPAQSVWVNAMQPISFLNYFLAGVFGCRLYRLTHLNLQSDGFMLFLVAAFIIALGVPVVMGIPRIELLKTGWAPLFYFAFCAGLTFAAAIYRCRSTHFVRISTILGEISYSVYLIHLPLYFQARKHLGQSIDGSSLLIICAVASVVLAKVLHDMLESPARRYGKSILIRESSKPRAGIRLS